MGFTFDILTMEQIWSWIIQLVTNLVDQSQSGFGGH